jgi:hypothetical protein
MLPIQVSNEAVAMDISIAVGCFNGARLFNRVPIVRSGRFLKINFIDYLLRQFYQYASPVADVLLLYAVKLNPKRMGTLEN